MMAAPPDARAALEAAWRRQGRRESLVLFGPRRQGKTHLIRQLAGSPGAFGEDARVATLNLQSVAWAEGARDLCHAIAAALWAAGPDGGAEPAPEAFARRPLAALDRFLAGRARRSPPRRDLLLLDEYELLAELPDARQAGLLRALLDAPHLATGFVGLHHPDELAPPLRDALAGCPALLVGRLDPAAFAWALAAGAGARAPQFAPDARERAFALTGGQPFLGRVLGEVMAIRDADRAGAGAAFAAADVDAAAGSPAFALGARPYFAGHWARADERPPGQRAVLAALAPHEGGLDAGRLRAESGLDPAALDAALASLARHDAVETREGRHRFGVELLRRRVAAGLGG
ncbi:MAG: AAA family ATPase [bacterium]|nr:AAA family ATPase [bacterium]